MGLFRVLISLYLRFFFQSMNGYLNGANRQWVVAVCCCSVLMQCVDAVQCCSAVLQRDVAACCCNYKDTWMSRMGTGSVGPKMVRVAKLNPLATSRTIIFLLSSQWPDAVTNALCIWIIVSCMCSTLVRECYWFVYICALVAVAPCCRESVCI